MKRLIVFALAGVLLATGCSNADGNSVQSLRAAAGVTAQASPPTQPPEQLPPAPPQPTETPPAISVEMPQPPQVIEVTREIVREVPATVQVEVTRVIVQEIQITPQPAQVDCNTLALTPMPTIQLDESDIAAGVVLRGQWQPCAYETAVAYEVQP